MQEGCRCFNCILKILHIEDECFSCPSSANASSTESTIYSIHYETTPDQNQQVEYHRLVQAKYLQRLEHDWRNNVQLPEKLQPYQNVFVEIAAKVWVNLGRPVGTYNYHQEMHRLNKQVNFADSLRVLPSRRGSLKVLGCRNWKDAGRGSHGTSHNRVEFIQYPRTEERRINPNMRKLQKVKHGHDSRLIHSAVYGRM